jgi:hypothetical protein
MQKPLLTCCWSVCSQAGVHRVGPPTTPSSNAWQTATRKGRQRDRRRSKVVYVLMLEQQAGRDINPSEPQSG